MTEKAAKLLDLFMHDKPTGIMLSLKDSTGKYASVLSKETDCTYTHTLKILSQMQALGIVEFEKKGRIKFVKLTPAGVEMARSIDGFVKKLRRLVPEKRPKAKQIK